MSYTHRDNKPSGCGPEHDKCEGTDYIAVALTTGVDECGVPLRPSVTEYRIERWNSSFGSWGNGCKLFGPHTDASALRELASWRRVQSEPLRLMRRPVGKWEVVYHD